MHACMHACVVDLNVRRMHATNNALRTNCYEAAIFAETSINLRGDDAFLVFKVSSQTFKGL